MKRQEASSQECKDGASDPVPESPGAGSNVCWPPPRVPPDGAGEEASVLCAGPREVAGTAKLVDEIAELDKDLTYFNVRC